jgi:hypothetical protein
MPVGVASENRFRSRFLTIAASICAMAAFGLGCRAADPLAEVRTHHERIVALVEEARTPSEAAERLRAYADAHGEALAAASRDLARYLASADEAPRRASRARLAQVEGRYARLVEDRPELLADDGVSRALSVLLARTAFDEAPGGGGHGGD